MSAISYLNGSWVPAAEAQVPMEDRGHQFGDGVYEVIAYYNRKMLDYDLHLNRLKRSLKEVRITNHHSDAEWNAIFQGLIDHNRATHGNIYVQVTRGAYPRDHRFKDGVSPSVTGHIFAQKTPEETTVLQGMSSVSLPDLRWKRCDIKTINLLPNILARQTASEAGAIDALLVKDNGEVSEASVCNAFAILEGTLVTHPANHEILAGITRQNVIQLAKKNHIPVEERPFFYEELFRPNAELFLTNTTSNLMPIALLDNKTIGDGKSGPITLKLLQAYFDHIHHQTGYRIYG